MSKLLKSLVNKDDELLGYVFKCPGCDTYHSIHTEQRNSLNAIWSFNGNMEKPTFSPSLLVKWNVGKNSSGHICHSFIRDGVWEFLNDCTHKLAGQKVPMLEIE